MARAKIFWGGEYTEFDVACLMFGFGMGNTPSLAWREHCKRLLFFTGFHLANTSNLFYVCLSSFLCAGLTEFVTQSSRKISSNIICVGLC